MMSDVFCFFKQKTAYEMRISDWSSDVCSSDLKIKSYGTWARVTESNWVIVTTKTAVQIRDDLLTVLDSNDRLFVVKSGREAAWHNSRCKNEWLKAKL